MKYVIIAVIACAAAVGIMFWAFTKKGLAYRKEQGASNIAIGVMIALLVFFWGMDVYNAVTGEATDLLTYVFAGAGPVIIVGWCIYTRSKTKKEMEASKKRPKNPGQNKGPRLK